MAEQTPESSQPPTLDRGNALALVQRASGKISQEVCGAIEWAQDQLFAPSSSAARRAFLEVREGVRKRIDNSIPVSTFLRSTDALNFFLDAKDQATRRLHARAGYPGMAWIDVLEQSRGAKATQEAEHLKRENIQITQALKLDEPGRLEAGVTHIAALMAEAIKKGESKKRMWAVALSCIRGDDGISSSTSSSLLDGLDAIKAEEAAQIFITSREFNGTLSKHSREEDIQNQKLVAAVKVALAEQHNITVQEEAPETSSRPS
ncbi:MAG: hypothetical protein WC882_03125 [Candidatus Gracilibacteria bacterium]